jgi:hypothetical protein
MHETLGSLSTRQKEEKKMLKEKMEGEASREQAKPTP